MVVQRKTPEGESRGSISVPSGEDKNKPHPTAPKGITQLITAIAGAGYKVTGTPGHWMVQCPFHEDAEPSLGVDVVRRSDEPCGWRVLINCRLCGKVGKQLSERFGVLWGDVLHHPDNRLLLERPPKRPAPLPSSDQINLWCEALQVTKDLPIPGTRYIDGRALAHYDIGWDTQRDCYTLPVYENGELVNLRRYYLDRKPKMVGLAGRNIHLYPDVPESGWLLLCEGEWDALVGRSHGLPTVTSTGGACGWKPGWDDYFEHRDLVIIYDSDTVGRVEAYKRALALETIACRIKIVDLAPNRNDGFDLSDWFLPHWGTTLDELFALMKSAPVFRPLGKNEGGRS